MRLSLGAILRRARRLGLTSPFSHGHHLFSSPSPTQHIKIDDEEQRSAHPLFTPRAPLIRLLKMILLSLLVLMALLLLIAYTIYKPPQPLIKFFQWKYPDVLFQLPLPSSSRVVALTLDDAPSDQTSKMLDLLKSYNARATFFVIGSQIAAHPGLLQRMHDEGHAIGNHAWADEPSINLPVTELERQIKEVESLLPPNSPGFTKYFRPGSGFFSSKMVDSVGAMGYRMVLGSIFPFDSQIHSARINSEYVLSRVRPGGIIIMHDRRDFSAEQLELVLTGLAAEEWKVESVGGLLGITEDLKEKKSG
jgi:peptidoglycan/xylan/chitin deacetylase (PgdA/CDA1 family)